VKRRKDGTVMRINGFGVNALLLKVLRRYVSVMTHILEKFNLKFLSFVRKFLVSTRDSYVNTYVKSM